MIQWKHGANKTLVVMFSFREAENVYNVRKLNELPYCLVHAGNMDELKTQTLCNFNFLYYKMKALGFDRYEHLLCWK